MREKLTNKDKFILGTGLFLNKDAKVYVLTEFQRKELIKYCKENEIENVEDRIFIRED